MVSEFIIGAPLEGDRVQDKGGKLIHPLRLPNILNEVPSKHFQLSLSTRAKWKACFPRVYRVFGFFKMALLIHLCVRLLTVCASIFCSIQNAKFECEIIINLLFIYYTIKKKT